MAGKQWISIFLLLLAISFSLACSSSSGSSPNQQAQAALSIALNPAPATSVTAGSTTGIVFTPVVSNDPADAGVDWALTCPLTTQYACGTLSVTNLHSASGTAVTYLPPAYFSTGTLTVNVTVFASGDHTKNIITPVTVTSYANVLNGTYVLQIQGTDATPNPYQSTGVFVFDGKGNVTSGQQTLNSVTNFSTTYTLQASSVAPSTYFVGPDGRGNMTLNLAQDGTSNTNQETFTFIVISTSQALIAELDASSSTTGSGTLELQSATAAGAMPTGAYAFVTRGSDAGSASGPGFITTGTAAPVPTAMGGVFNIDNNPSPGSIDGNGSLADQDYYNAKFSSRKLISCAPPTGVTGSVSAPVSLGIVTITLTAPAGATCFGQSTVQFTGYIVDATHIRLIEIDDINGSSGFLTAGIAVNQGSAAGTFTDTSLMGSYVFGVLGYDLNYGTAVPASFTSAGVAVSDGSGTISGINDTLFLSEDLALTGSKLSGNYTNDDPTLVAFGRVDYTPRFTGLQGNPGPGVHLLFYLTGNGTSPLLLWSEGEDPNYPAIGTGIAYPQSTSASPSTFSFGNPETYGFGLTENPSATEIDATGDTATTVSGILGSMTGSIDNINGNNDFNYFGGLGNTPPTPLFGSFTLPADTFGHIAGTFMSSPGSGTAGPYFDYFLIDDKSSFMIETDLLNAPNGTPTVSLGYFAQSCDVTSATSCRAAASQSSKRALGRAGSRTVRRNSNIAH